MCLSLLIVRPSFSDEPVWWARIDLVQSVTNLSIPIYAHLQDATGQDYVLAFATQTQLDDIGWPYRMLATGGSIDDYLLVHSRAPRTLTRALTEKVLHDDGRLLLVRARPEEAETWAALGFEVRRLPSRPIVETSPALSNRERSISSLLATFAYTIMIDEMIRQVQTTNLYNEVKRLTAIDPLLADGSLYPQATRHTSNQTALQKATQYALEFLRSLGYTVRYQNWSRSGYSSRNVIASRAGGSLSNEIIVVIAHLDNMPSGSLAPGADDNASGCAAVLTAAGILRKYRFDRTIHFALVTGEEQGLYGSAAYADELYAGGDNVIAVLNMDMIAWNSDSNPRFELHTRTTGSGGYAADRAIAAVFTNVVRTYNLSAHLTPVILSDSAGWSDHASFWNVGYPAIVAIEDDYDFNPYYHTVNDTLSRFNLTYFTHAVKAVVGTAAHLAQPVEPIRFDSIRIDHGEWTVGGPYGISSLTLRHETGATETGPDGYDRAWTNTTPPASGTWFKIHSAPYADPLSTDARPTNSETMFHSLLSVVRTNSGTAFGSTNRLRFSFHAPTESNRVYSVRVHIDAAYATNGQSVDIVTNLRQIVAGDGFLRLPGLRQLTNTAVYGFCEVGTHLIDPETNRPLGQLALQNGTVMLDLPVQAGVDMIDRLEGSTNLLAGWIPLAVRTNRVPVSSNNFESGWQDVSISLTNFAPTSRALMYRVRRQWLAP